MGRELFEYTKFMIGMRKAHGILRSRTLLRGIDALPCGFPNVSFHGREAWKPDTSPASRYMGIMYCGFYAAEEEKGDDGEYFFYIAVNMHWQVNYMGLPKLPKGKCWVYRASTGKEIPEIEEDAASQEICVPPRTIVLCTTKEVPVEAEKLSGKKGGKAGKERSGRTVRKSKAAQISKIKGMKEADE